MISGNSGYYSGNPSAIPSAVKFQKTTKFEGKVLVWIAISAKEISSPLIRKSGFAINAQTYMRDCLRARLISFIRKYHLHDNYVFWPYLAGAHYARTVIEHKHRRTDQQNKILHQKN
mgnify:FL=1